MNVAAPASVSLRRARRARSHSFVAVLLRDPVAVAALLILVPVIACALLAPVLAPFDPLATDWSAIRQAPSLEHLFGTDEIGRDVLSRVIFGARASLFAGIVAVGVALCLGVPTGLLSGYASGTTDTIIMRITDAVLAVPPLVLAIALSAFLGPNLTNATIAIGIAVTPAIIRLTRAQALAAREEDYVEAARAVGNPEWRIALRHVLPNILPAVAIQSTLTMAFAVITEASLSFLGVGQQAPEASWGSMLTTAKNFLDVAPWLAIFPAAAIFLTVLALNLLGDALRDTLDPRNRRS